MDIVNFFRRLFGIGERSPSSPDSSPRLAGAAVALEPLPEQRDPGILMHREEILDAHPSISGYRFSVASLNTSTPPSAQAVASALKADNLVNFVQRRMAVIPVKVEDWQVGDFQQFITPNAIFLVGAPAADSDIAAWQAGLERIKESGARVALNSSVLSLQSPALLSLADLLFIKFSGYPLDVFDRMVASLRAQHPQLILVADEVLSWPDYRMCISIGIIYCLGGFATTPDEEDKSERLTPNRLILVQMLNLLRRDAAVSELSEIAKRDPGVIVSIVEMANSPLYGLSAPIASLNQAIAVLGREHLYRWLTSAIFRAGISQGRDEALLEIALSRARFLELLAVGRCSKKESDEMFVVGLLSLMDRLLGMPMEEVLKKMHLPANVEEVLLKSDGPYARYLMLALSLEKRHTEMAIKLADALDLDSKMLVESNAAALIWAERAMKAM